jgi:hypothetical protein
MHAHADAQALQMHKQINDNNCESTSNGAAQLLP